jgi:hypothetical protein
VYHSRAARGKALAKKRKAFRKFARNRIPFHSVGVVKWQRKWERGMKNKSIFFAVLAAFEAWAAEPVWNSDTLKPEGVIVFDGKTSFRIDNPGLPPSMKAFTIAGWIRPDAFDSYNEIFRIDSDAGRVLFSFQGSGSLLSLGLSAGTYLECDSSVPAKSRVMPGFWHFVAGVYDGKTMRVFWDDAEIGSCAAPAPTAAVARMPGFLGSYSGTLEFFRGAMAHIRLFTAALTTDELAAIHKAERGPFDKEAMNENAFRSALRAAADSLNEFMPITEFQWNEISAAERAEWEKARAWQKAVGGLLALSSWRKSESDEAVRLMQAMPADVCLDGRPVVSEAVAPRVMNPTTPSPRAYSKEEVRQAIEADWLFQVGGKPDPAKELARTRSFLKRFEKAPQMKEWSAALDAVEADMKAAKTDAKTAYIKIREVKRAVMLANPAITFSKLLLCDSPYPAGSEWMHETRHREGYMTVPGGQLLVLDGLSFGTPRRLMPSGPLDVPGSFWRPDVSYDGQRVLFCFKAHNDRAFHIYEINADGSGLRQITSGVFDDIDPVYLPDGKRFVFCSTRSYTYVRCMPPTNAMVLMRCGLDGSGLYFISANNEPDYLPSVLNDGRIIHTRWEYTDKPLWRDEKLWTMNPDGTQPNTFWGSQSVWPDVLTAARSIPGSRRVMFLGTAHHNWFAGSVGILDQTKGLNFPNGLTKVTADHEWPECGNGPTDPHESADYAGYGFFGGYYSPWPISERDLLVSACRNGKFVLYLMDVDGNRELLYEGCQHIFDAMPLAARPVPPAIADRVAWPTEKERLSPEDGTIYSANVYDGAPEVMRGKIKYLRVFYLEQKTYTFWDHRPALSTGPVVSLNQTDGVKRLLGVVPVAEDGSVNFSVPSCVSLHFQALDANHRALQTMRSFVSVQPGESRGCLGCHELHSRTPIQQSRVLSKAATGKPLGLVAAPWAFDAPGFATAPEGCATLDDAMRIAAEKQKAASPEARARVHRFGTSVGYIRDVQPVLDRYCGKCHEGDGKARKKFDLTPSPWQPYLTIIGWPGWMEKDNMSPWARPKDIQWSNIDRKNPPPGYDLAGTWKIENFSTVDPAAYVTFPPMQKMSYTSPLVKILSGEKDHHGVKADPYSLLRVILWVDAMCPYLTDADIRESPDPVFQGSDWIPVKPRMKTAALPVRPGPFSAKADAATQYRELGVQECPAK